MAKPSSNFDFLSFQDRDLTILQGLFECRVMSSEHVATLYFSGSKDAGNKRLIKLKAEGLINERERRANELSILFLTQKGFAVLREKGKLAEYSNIPQSSLAKRGPVADLMLQHELEVMDVKAALYASVSKTEEFTIAEFSTWPLLYQFEIADPDSGGTKILIKPDGFIRIHKKLSDTEALEHSFFLEVDRSNEVQNRLGTRGIAYLRYYTSGGFAERNGAPRSACKNFPFRALMVLQTPARRNNTAEELLRGNPPVYRQTWLTTLAEIKADPLGEIWVSPDSYRVATQNTPFDPMQQSQGPEYRKQANRELFVESTIRKMRLLDPAFNQPAEGYQNDARSAV